MHYIGVFFYGLIFTAFLITAVFVLSDMEVKERDFSCEAQYMREELKLLPTAEQCKEEWFEDCQLAAEYTYRLQGLRP